ncbi:MAG: hypothetical protein CM15mP79_0760 [Methanobacteriota archaeon]|nr:MAG: hypothetical protein CM15mP79_0760 [Euryarchaeota archaeon]
MKALRRVGGRPRHGTRHAFLAVDPRRLGLCTFGVLILPVGLTCFSERPRRGKGVMIVGTDGQIQPMTPGGAEAFGIPTQQVGEQDLPFDPVTGAYREPEGGAPGRTLRRTACSPPSRSLR